jgi:hypothetical protein
MRVRWPLQGHSVRMAAKRHTMELKMSSTKHVLRVVEARRIQHPIFPKIEKHSFLVTAKNVPPGISLGANARDAKTFNKRVYQDVKRNLIGEDPATPGYFDLMNKGITIIAEQVKRIDDKNYEVVILPNQGVVDGGHTYKLICSLLNDPRLREEQHVEINVRTGVASDMYAEVSRGLNTGIQVAQHSLDNLAGHYDWLKLEIDDQPYVNLFAWREADDGEYDVRELICVLEAMNILDFPNESGLHPIQAYEKWSVPTQKFSRDAEEHESELSKSKYFRLRTILKEALMLYDTIRKDFYEVYNDAELGAAGRLNIVEQARGDQLFRFPFADLPPAKYRLTKGALFPIFAAFRNMVEIDPESGNARWTDDFDQVLGLWKDVAPEVCRVTKTAIQDIGNQPEVLGKNRGHWSNMHKTIELFVLRRQLAHSQSNASKRGVQLKVKAS